MVVQQEAQGVWSTELDDSLQLSPIYVQLQQLELVVHIIK